ncbi:hypothetical protein Ahu01nite_080810 [Winogradskya humida]|uniref:Uncharacterized protein n=1 Tax=Winogradskya humida TaxID=113566 RepID=A0ABQ4A2A0_9ACTN|nr:hypothetical protein Ahu01nite_080810 [Actinoplanes humidus]
MRDLDEREHEDNIEEQLERRGPMLLRGGNRFHQHGPSLKPGSAGQEAPPSWVPDTPACVTKWYGPRRVTIATSPMRYHDETKTCRDRRIAEGKRGLRIIPRSLCRRVHDARERGPLGRVTALPSLRSVSSVIDSAPIQYPNTRYLPFECV